MREVGRGQPMAERVGFCESVMWRRAGGRGDRQRAQESR